jgi:NodT family efflux transporter outer membrane factor (OMF) lipoprotein
MALSCSNCFFLAAFFTIAFAGCAVGPDFRPPDPAIPQSYTAASLPSKTASAPVTGGSAQEFIFAEDVSAQWWTLFESPELDRLVRRGLGGSPSLSAAEAALRKAAETLSAVRGGLYPGFDLNALAVRDRTSTNTYPPVSIFTVYNASVNVSYAFDFFGGLRRRIEGAQAQVDYRRYQREAAYLSLTANIVTTAIQEAALRAQIRSIDEIESVEGKQLAVVERQVHLGALPQAALLAQQSQVAMTRAMLPSLEKQLTFARHALALLIGEFPSEEGMSELHLETLHLPGSLPVSLPSRLVRQRPDIRASEALLHAACAEVGVATSNLYPQITLSAGYGAQSMSTGTLFAGESSAWNIGAGLLQPIFRGGELTARRRAAIAAYDQSAAEYRQTILKAFRDVADVLRALETDAEALRAHVEAENAAKAALDLIGKQFRLGASNYPLLLIAQRDYLKAHINVITAQAQRYADTASLFQALGGGWWNRPATPVYGMSEREGGSARR